jgi:cadmium resistance protein CadD (predicted permease)
VWQAVVLFAVTNVDDLVVIAVFFARAASHSAVRRVVVGQYLGFLAIVALSLAGAYGAGQLPTRMVAFLGLVPIALGLWSAFSAWRSPDEPAVSDDLRLSRLAVAAVTVANGGDNIGVYVPAFASRSVAELVGTGVIFLILVAALCAGGYVLSRHRLVASVMARWGQVVYPVALIAVGVWVLASGGAFS